MVYLARELRKVLEKTVVAAREDAERGVQAMFDRLLLTARDQKAIGQLTAEQRALRNRLRERARQLGRGRTEKDALLENEEAVAEGLPHLREELAYEVWHRMLFARFLAENELLLHPEHQVPLSLDDCAEIADEANDGSDAWDIAARFAAARLPGLFAHDGLSGEIALSLEDKRELEMLLDALPAELFQASDALGWVYQFWQKKKKDEVYASERKIGGADLSPVTQLFTEDYMVRFLLENSLGAWWSARHPASPLLAEWDYLRFRDDGAPAAGRFESWPERVAEVTVLDPCCGSGHFLVAAFDMLVKMRMEEEGIAPGEAADRVLRDNLFGLELDARCTQIATFAVALAAWQAGGSPERQVPRIACSGTPVRGQLADWKKLAKGDTTVEFALTELHRLFADAPTLGSLIDPQRTIKTSGVFGISWDSVAAIMEQAATREQATDPASALFGGDAIGAAKAASLLGRSYTLVATNVPYLTRGKQDKKLADFVAKEYPAGKAELATAFLLRCLAFTEGGGTVCIVTPQNWLSLGSYRNLRTDVLDTSTLNAVVPLGPAAFQDMNWWAATTLLTIVTHRAPALDATFVGIDASTNKLIEVKDDLLRSADLTIVNQHAQHENPDQRIVLEHLEKRPLLSEYAHSLYGLRTGDLQRFSRLMWELESISKDWKPFQSTTSVTKPFGGLEQYLLWENGHGSLKEFSKLGIASLQGSGAWGKYGVIVSQMRQLPVSLYRGDIFDNNVVPIWPKNPDHLTAIWAFCSSPEFNKAVRRIDTKLNVTNATLVKVPFDLDHWQQVADQQYPNGLPEPHSDDPTQWLFTGTIPGSDAPLQVAAARLLGYRWPEQADDGLDALADPDGIVCLPSVAGEQPAAERLRALLQHAYGDDWTEATRRTLFAQAGASDLDAWLRDRKGFFAQHVRLFHNRPFIWQISDGARDGFSALVNAHKLTAANLDKLIYTYLGDWIRDLQRDADANVSGAAGKLARALELQQKLVAISIGEPPYDIYVRWKSLAGQPIGWEPDLNDGVRLNIRPFIEAGVLQAPFSINWNKDRGKDPKRPVPDLRAIPEARRDAFQRHYSVDRYNDLHFTRAEKAAAREAASRQAEASERDEPVAELDGGALRQAALTANRERTNQ